MKNLIFTFAALLLFASVIQAQQPLTYQVYVIASNGKVLNKTYQDTQELTLDRAIQDLHIGYLKGKEFVFTPEESKHNAFFVKKSGANDAEKHVLFEAWDGQAARQIEKAMNIHFGEPAQPVKVQQEKLSASAVKPEGKKGLEEELLQQLTQDGLIKKDDRKISIVLTRSALVVNSKKQPEQILAKYKTLVESFRGTSIPENFRYEYTSEVSY
jgi:hypothetical protein